MAIYGGKRIFACKFVWNSASFYNTMVKRFQNRISGSRFLLATVAVITVLTWLASGLLSAATAVNLALIAATAYFLVELDTRNSIIRIYSRMIPSSFLVLATMSGAFVNDTFAYTCLLWTLFMMFFFSSYQDKTASGRVFLGFMFLGIASLLFVQTLFFLPVLWLVMSTNLMSFSRRTFLASIIGVIIPYWFIGGFLLLKGDLSFFATHFTDIAVFGNIFDFSMLRNADYVTLVVMVVLSITGAIHCVRNSNKDKIRTRMFCELLTTLNLFATVFIILQPVHFTSILPVLTISTSALISHYIVLTNTRLTNISVYLIIAVVYAATIYNLWIS